MKLTIPAAVLRVLYHLEQSGHPAYIVGGSLRDALMGKRPHDWDVTTAARPEQMLEIFGSAGLTTIPTGLQHGTVTVLVRKMPVECTTYRIDGAYTDARHPDRVDFTDRISDDLARRDFTVNAMACRLPAARTWKCPPASPLTVTENEVEILDLFGGREDLQNRIIRCVGEPEKRFEEDALRILRAVRFSAQLGFSLEANTARALTQKRAGLGRISVERVASELTRTLTSPRPSRGLVLLRERSLWEDVLPESRPSESPYFTSEKRLFSTVDHLPRCAMLRLALLLSNNEPDTARAVCRRLKLSNDQTAAVEALVRGISEPIPADEIAARRLLSRYGEHADGVLHLLALCHDRASAARARDLIKTVRRRGDCLHISGLAVDGKALMSELGLRGREVGQTLNALLEAVLDDASRNTRQTLLQIAKEQKK